MHPEKPFSPPKLSLSDAQAVTELLTGGGASSRREFANNLAIHSARLDEAPVLVVALCAYCKTQVLRNFHIEENLLVIGPWRHRYYRSDHEVEGIIPEECNHDETGKSEASFA